MSTGVGRIETGRCAFPIVGLTVREATVGVTGLEIVGRSMFGERVNPLPVGERVAYDGDRVLAKAGKVNAATKSTRRVNMATSTCSVDGQKSSKSVQ